MGWWSSNRFVNMGGRFPNHPYGNSGLDGDDRWRVRGRVPRLHGCWLFAGTTDVGTGSCGRGMTGQSRRCGLRGKGNHKGCPYGGRMWWWSSNGLVSLGGRFPNRPYGKSGRWGMMGKGTHEGLPLRGEDGVVVVERVRQYGRAVPEPPLRRKIGDGR